MCLAARLANPESVTIAVLQIGQGDMNPAKDGADAMSRSRSHYTSAPLPHGLSLPYACPLTVAGATCTRGPCLPCVPLTLLLAVLSGAVSIS